MTDTSLNANIIDAGQLFALTQIKSVGIAVQLEVMQRRAGYDETFISEAARIMEYSAAYAVYREDVEYEG